MRQNTINLLLGLGALVGTLFGAYGLARANAALNAYGVAVDSVSRKVTIDPPAAVVKAATEKAMDNAIDAIAKTELSDAKKAVTEVAMKTVASAVNDAANSIDLSSTEVKNQIIKGAGEKVGDFVMDKLKNMKFGSSMASDDVSIIKTCTEAGMNSWDIQRLLEATKK